MYVRAGRPAFARPCVGVHEFAPGFLAGPSGIRAGWVLETKSRLGAE